MGVEKGRAARPDLKVGICGEHGGDPASIAFCHDVGLNYVQLLTLPRAGGAPRRGAGGDRVGRGAGPLGSGGREFVAEEASQAEIRRNR